MLVCTVKLYYNNVSRIMFFFFFIDIESSGVSKVINNKNINYNNYKK